MARARAFRLMIWAVVVTGLLLAGHLVPERPTEAARWRLGLSLALVLEGAYLFLVGSVAVVTPILLVQLARGKRGPRLAKALLLVLSLGTAALLAESTTALVEARRGRESALPVGGLRPRRANEKPVSLPEPRPIPLPGRFVDDERPNTLRIVVVGESSAEGVPYNRWCSIGRLIGWKLEEVLPERAIEVETIATSGETLESQHRKLANLKHRPDLLIVYSGHNEFSARFPWSRDIDFYHDARDPSWRERAYRFAEGLSPLCRTARLAADTCRVAIPPPANGNRDLVDTPVCTDREFAVLKEDFARRLQTIVSWANQVGALVVLIAPAGNDSGFEPNRSYLSAETTAAERSRAAREFLAAKERDGRDDAAARLAFEGFLKRYPTFAEAHFRLGRLMEKEGDFAGAYEHDIVARDRDGLPMRLPTDFQRAYQEVASTNDLICIDMQEHFHRIGDHGLLDEHLFFDAMHPSLRGQIAIAQAVLASLKARGAFDWPDAVAAPVFDPKEVVERCRLDDFAWYTLAKWGSMFYDLTSPARYDPSERRERLVEHEVAVTRLKEGVAPEKAGPLGLGVPEAVPAYPIDLRGRPLSAKAP